MNPCSEIIWNDAIYDFVDYTIYLITMVMASLVFCTLPPPMYYPPRHQMFEPFCYVIKTFMAYFSVAQIVLWLLHMLKTKIIYDQLVHKKRGENLDLVKGRWISYDSGDSFNFVYDQDQDVRLVDRSFWSPYDLKNIQETKKYRPVIGQHEWNRGNLVCSLVVAAAAVAVHMGFLGIYCLVDHLLLLSPSSYPFVFSVHIKFNRSPYLYALFLLAGLAVCAPFISFREAKWLLRTNTKRVLRSILYSVKTNIWGALNAFPNTVHYFCNTLRTVNKIKELQRKTKELMASSRVQETKQDEQNENESNNVQDDSRTDEQLVNDYAFLGPEKGPEKGPEETETKETTDSLTGICGVEEKEKQIKNPIMMHLLSNHQNPFGNAQVSMWKAYYERKKKKRENIEKKEDKDAQIKNPIMMHLLSNHQNPCDEVQVSMWNAYYERKKKRENEQEEFEEIF